VRRQVNQCERAISPRSNTTAHSSSSSNTGGGGGGGAIDLNDVRGTTVLRIYLKKDDTYKTLGVNANATVREVCRRRRRVVCVSIVDGFDDGYGAGGGGGGDGGLFFRFFIYIKYSFCFLILFVVLL